MKKKLNDLHTKTKPLNPHGQSESDRHTEWTQGKTCVAMSIFVIVVIEFIQFIYCLAAHSSAEDTSNQHC